MRLFQKTSALLILSVSLLSIGPANAVSADPEKYSIEQRKALLALVQEKLKSADVFLAIEAIEGIAAKPVSFESSVLVCKRYFFLIIDSYTAKDMTTMIRIGEHGVSYMLRQAKSHKADQKQYKLLRSYAQMASFNLSMNTWSGWPDQTNQISAEAARIGLEMARLDQRLVLEEKLPNKKKATATWAIGIHLMTAKSYAAAEKSFDEALTYAKAAGVKSEILMMEGYRAINSALKNKQVKSPKLDEIILMLSKIGDSDSKYYAKQLPEVFTRLCSQTSPKATKPSTKQK